MKPSFDAWITEVIGGLGLDEAQLALSPLQVTLMSTATLIKQNHYHLPTISTRLVPPDALSCRGKDGTQEQGNAVSLLQGSWVWQTSWVGVDSLCEEMVMHV